MTQHARDEAGNVWEVDAQGNPVRLVQAAGAPAARGQVFTLPKDPTKAQKDALDVQEANARVAKMQRDAAATDPFARQNAANEAAIKSAQATIDKSKADQAVAEEQLATMAPNSELHGEAYLQKFVPKEMWNTVRAFARGDLGARAGLSKSMLPIVQHVMNYDPTASGANFPSRVKMQQSLADKDPNSAGGALRSMEQMLLHGVNVLRSGQSLDNFHAGIGSVLNYPRAAYESVTSDPALAAFQQDVRNYAPESQKAVAGTAGGEGERQDRSKGYSATMSPESLASTLQQDAHMAYERIGATNNQYKRIMGRDITDQLSPEAKVAYDEIMAGGYGKDGKPLHPAPGWQPISGANPAVPPSIGGAPPPGSPPGPVGGTPTIGPGLVAPGGGGVNSIASGAMKSVPDAEGNRVVDNMLRSGKSVDEINAMLANMGRRLITPESFASAKSWMAKNPGYHGGFANLEIQQPTTGLDRFNASAPGAFTRNLFNGLTFDNMDSVVGMEGGDPAKFRADTTALYRAHPLASDLGMLTGGTGAAAGVEMGGTALAGRLGLGGAKALPWVRRGADALYGGLEGAGANDENRLQGGLTGGALGIGGGMFGRRVLAPAIAAPIRALAGTDLGQSVINGGRSLLGKAPLAPPPMPVPSSDLAILKTANKGGLSGITDQLSEASRLGVPLTLADTDAGLRSLAGAAVRRSPNASQIAENALLPRSRGQIDRFGQAVERDLGPVANVPQLSADLTNQAKAAAGPLYDAAYAAPGVNSDEITSLLNTPFGKQALSSAHGIAANERVDPTSLGIDLNAQGEPVLNRVPSMKTLDYVKRGMDAVLEQHRNPITGRLDLNGPAAAQNQVKNQLLTEMDRLNPDYAAARAAYSGPMQSRDALQFGQDAVGMSPNTLGVGLNNRSPEQLAQIQLGYRSGLMDQANKVRYSTNPFDATLGTPAAEQRLGSLYPNNPGTADLLRTRDLEAQAARTANDVLGNSKTAQRMIADQSFGNDIPQLALDAGINIATGQVPTSLLLKKGSAQALKDAMQFGLGKKAVAKADAMAPTLLNPDPQASADALTAIMNDAQARQAFVRSYNRRFGGPLGMFGAGLGGTFIPSQ